MPNYKGRKLILNLSPIKYEDKALDVGVFEFHDKDQLRGLRKEHFRTHVFRRVGNEILCVRFKAGAPLIGDSFREITLKKNVGLAAALVQNALLNYLHAIGRQIFEYVPLTFSDSQTNFIAASLRKGISCPPWLALRPSYEADIRVVTIDRYSPFVGLALNVQTMWFIDRTCRDLLGEGFPLVGLYVG